ncbi:secondary thiamine-phosphate synthase enzyme YjbQ [Ruminococcaceae bacterium OttesenSCG-928-L11]|nr:secondary thiamine-phosphate synthase enzyme YjbQ [Ruminococcaceae bacterium OttesenSCG-928-L11]
MTTQSYTLSTQRQGFYKITAKVRDALQKSGVVSGICVVYCPHITGAITLNENADPDVVHDLLLGLDSAFPEDKRFRHFEGNSTAHLKSGATGVSQTVIVENGDLLLGRWQDLYFCEFDGPRTRTFYVKIIEDVHRA